jgi:calcineurin-like phosphoesterase family protein
MRRIGILSVCMGLLLVSCATAPPGIIVHIEEGPQPWTSLDLNNDPDHFQFAIVTDRTGGMRPGIFEDAVRKLNLLQPEFVMSVGDLIPGGTEDLGALDAEWEEFDGFVNALEMPFFYVPGNHDITNLVMDQVWKERLGPTYYHFVYRDVLFLCLSTEDPPHTQMSAAQAEYARKALAENPDVRWTLVFMHKPLWTYEGDTGWAAIEAMLRGRKHTVFAGHWHDYTKFVRNDSNYIVLATTGAGSKLRGPLFGEFDHAVWVTMLDDGPRIANLMLDGIWDEDIRTEEVTDLVDPLIRGRGVQGEPVLLESGKRARTETKLRLTNNADIPMKLRLDVRSPDGLKVKPLEHSGTIPPNSVEFATLVLSVSDPKVVPPFEPIVVDWNVEYVLAEGDTITLDGSLQIEVKTASDSESAPNSR